MNIPFDSSMYDDGIITYQAPKRARRVFNRLAADLGFEFKRVKKTSKADIVVNFEEEISYGPEGNRGWFFYRKSNGYGSVGVLKDLPNKARNSVLAHELGHAFGLSHYTGGIMMPPTITGDWFTPDHISAIQDTFL